MTEEERKAKEAAEKEKADKAKADAAKADADKVTENEDLHAKMDKLMEMIGGMGTRMDSLEKARKDSEDGETEEKRKEREADEKKKADAERDEKAKADAESLKARMDAFEEKTKERSDDDMSAMADAQARADAVLGLRGDRAPPPMAGETVMGYRIRMAKRMQADSPAWKPANLTHLAADPAAFANAEAAIYADSEAAARRPANLPEGRLMERKRQIGPHTVSEFHGAGPRVWMDEFKRVNTRGRVLQIKAA